MYFILTAATVLTVATLVLTALAWGVLYWCGRVPAHFWSRALLTHLALFVVHVAVTVPLGIGFWAPHMVQTRSDEQGYAGPRLDAQGNWQLQSRETLKSEAQARARGETPVDPAIEQAAEQRALHFHSADGLPLRAFLVPSKRSPPRFVAVLAHGLFRGACELETVGSMLRDAGGEVLLCEYRNHGGSGRAKPTFGPDEAKDVLAAIAELRARPEAKGRPLVLFGVSLGTAAMMLAAPQVKDVAALILDAPLDDVHATGDRMLGTIGRRRGVIWTFPLPVRHLMLWSAQHLGGIDLDHIDLKGALKSLPPKLPILMIGAGKDDRVPPDAVRGLFSILPEPADKKELWIVDDAEHGKVWEKVPDEYRAHVDAFLDRALGPAQ